MKRKRTPEPLTTEEIQKIHERPEFYRQAKPFDFSPPEDQKRMAIMMMTNGRLVSWDVKHKCWR